MRAAKRFVQELEGSARLARTTSIKVVLYGSLAHTGKGHRTDSAILMGLRGEEPHTIDPSTIGLRVNRIIEQQSIKLLGTHQIQFNYENDLQFRKQDILPGPSNGMRFSAYDREHKPLSNGIFYSVGGGCIVAEHEEFEQANSWPPQAPFPFKSAADLLRLGRNHSIAIWEMMLANEESSSIDDVAERIFRFWAVMNECIRQGFQTEGMLPGELKIQRRAPNLYRSLSRSPIRGIPSRSSTGLAYLPSPSMRKMRLETVSSLLQPTEQPASCPPWPTTTESLWTARMRMEFFDSF